MTLKILLNIMILTKCIILNKIEIPNKNKSLFHINVGVVQALWSRGWGGQRVHLRPPKFSFDVLDVLFFSDESFKCALFTRSNQRCT